jgi:hypothetical protein
VRKNSGVAEAGKQKTEFRIQNSEFRRPYTYLDPLNSVTPELLQLL